MGCDLRDGRATAPESCGESFLKEVSLFKQSPEIWTGWNMGVWGVWGTGITAGPRVTRSGRRDSGVDVGASHTPSAYFPVTHPQPPSKSRALTCPVFSPGAVRPSNTPSLGSLLARCYHLSIQCSLSTHYILHTLLGIQSYIVKIHSPCSPRASGHFQAKLTSSVKQPFTSVSPTSLIPSSIFPDSVWVSIIRNFHIALLIA